MTAPEFPGFFETRAPQTLADSNVNRAPEFPFGGRVRAHAGARAYSVAKLGRSLNPQWRHGLPAPEFRKNRETRALLLNNSGA